MLYKLSLLILCAKIPNQLWFLRTYFKCLRSALIKYNNMYMEIYVHTVYYRSLSESFGPLAVLKVEDQWNM